MDSCAKQYRSIMDEHSSYVPISTFDHTHWSILINGKRISYRIEDQIKDHIQGRFVRERLIKRGDLTAQSFILVDWDSIDSASRSMTVGDSLWVTKFVSGFSATATHMHFREIARAAKVKRDRKEEEPKPLEECMDRLGLCQWKDNLCPLCRTERENTKHVLQCADNRIQQYRSSQFHSFNEWLLVQRTDPLIQQCIKHTLHAGPSASFLYHMSLLTDDKQYLMAAREQDAIGRTNFLFGHITKSWKILQMHYLNRRFPKKNYSVHAWSRRLISRIYRLSRSIWKFRCDTIHGDEHKLTSLREKKELRRNIREEYQKGSDGLRSIDRHLLANPVSEILASSIREQKYWIRTIKISRAYMKEREQNIFSGMRDILRTWARVPD